MPSLLMQAARSAAIADGLAIERANSSDPKNATKSASSAARIKPPGAHAGSNGDAVAAALAMVAAGNTKPPQTDLAKSNRAGGQPNRNIMRHGISPPASNIQANITASMSSHPIQARKNQASYPTQHTSMNSSSSSAGSAAYRLASQQIVAPKSSSTTPVSSQISQPTSASRSSSSGNGSSVKKKGPLLRRGKWTPDEEGYANRLITEFKAGLLPLTDGTTLRTFLSKLLNCDPMRISKKFVGQNCIGKQVFRRRTADINRLTTEQIQQSRAELSE